MNIVEMFKTKSENNYFYNITPCLNIPSIMIDGILSFNNVLKMKHKSIALEDVQDRRAKVIIPNGRALHDYANVYFDARNPMMYKRRNIVNSLCILVISPKILELSKVVISDRNASSYYTLFGPPEQMICNNFLKYDIIYARNWNDDNPNIKYIKKSIKCAEILVPDIIPYGYIIGMYVVNDLCKNEIIDMGFDKKIIINADIFFR